MTKKVRKNVSAMGILKLMTVLNITLKEAVF
jgi:hypothetical protein